MKTNILNRQTNHPIQQKNIQNLTDWLAEKLEKRTLPNTWSEVSIVLVDNDGITQTNREYFDKNHPTDVISFRYDPIPGEEDGWSGDLIINVDRALQEGTDRGNINGELALYIAHGFDHLSGAEDNTPEKQQKMRATEIAWLHSAEKEGLLKNLIQP